MFPRDDVVRIVPCSVRGIPDGKSSTTCRRGGNVGAEISIGPGASRSFSLSHPGPSTTHASAPDAPPPSLSRHYPHNPQFPSHPRRLSLYPSPPVFLPRATNPLLSLRFASSSHFRCRCLSSRFRRIDEDTILSRISVLSIFASSCLERERERDISVDFSLLSRAWVWLIDGVKLMGKNVVIRIICE